MVTKPDELYMREALKEAEQALSSKERPIGAVIVHQGHVIARAHHQVKLLRDPTAHATVIAITQATNTLQADQLASTTLYVTQEPCCMCIGAVLLSGIDRIIVGAEDVKQGACGSVINIPGNERLNRKLSVIKGVLASECVAMVRKAAVTSRT